ncbi:MAG TPA: DUF177 domain-containing protein [Cyclobacteriaceae bacterium]
MERYRINILGLSLNVHHFEYELGTDFLKKYDTGLVSEGTFKADVALDKRETFLDTSFKITGSVRLVCDRSLDEFDYPIDVSSKIIFKYGDEDKEISEDVMMIHRGTETLELGKYIYEFIALAVPMKKLHPRFKNESDEEGGIIYTSDTESEKKEEIDPRWEMLKKLNKN